MSGELHVPTALPQRECGSRILKCEGNKIWSDSILDKKFRSIEEEMGTRRTVGRYNKNKWHKIGYRDL
jgi:hypothetical protein